MHRHNGDFLRLRSIPVPPSNDVEGRSVCRTCGQTVPRGQDRPYCLEHAPYARALRRALAT
ncbi:MAG: hypothetical protein KF878_17305 [Planctomycetes bacterium]|nr:hypothetical protein [Planctomycetota bacterium]